MHSPRADRHDETVNRPCAATPGPIASENKEFIYAEAQTPRSRLYNSSRNLVRGEGDDSPARHLPWIAERPLLYQCAVAEAQPPPLRNSTAGGLQEGASITGVAISPPIDLTNQIFPSPYVDVESRYELLETLGYGSTSIVRRCMERGTGAEWACKSVAKEKLRSDADVEGLRAEVAAMRLVAHHALVARLHDVVEDEDHVHLIMEVCHGGDLYAAIVARTRYSERDAARVIRVVLSVLDYMNSKGIMHRDLKPENIVLASTSSHTKVKVIDFGLATTFSAGNHLEETVGSASYIAPEVVQKSYGPEADTWSLGVVLYTLLCGRPPFCPLPGQRRSDLFAAVLGAPVDTEWGPWRRISAAAKQMVHAMMTREVGERISVAEAKQHPWIQKYFRECLPVHPIPPSPSPLTPRTPLRVVRQLAALKLPLLPHRSHSRFASYEEVATPIQTTVDVPLDDVAPREVEVTRVAQSLDGTHRGPPIWELPDDMRSESNMSPSCEPACGVVLPDSECQGRAAGARSQNLTPRQVTDFPRVSRTSSAPIVSQMHVVDWDGMEEKEAGTFLARDSFMRKKKKKIVAKVQEIVSKPIGSWIRGIKLRATVSNASVISSPSSTPTSSMGMMSPTLFQGATAYDAMQLQPR